MIITPGYAAISMPFAHSGLARRAFITFGVKNNTTSESPASIANAVFAAATAATSLMSRIDADVVMGPVQAAVAQDFTAPLTGEGASTQAGGLVGSSVPSNVAVLIKKTSATGGRIGRGRNFLPWAVDEATVDQVGIIAVSQVALIQTAVTNFLNNLSAGNVPMVILHSTDQGLPPLVTALTPDRLVATQRRRLGRS